MKNKVYVLFQTDIWKTKSSRVCFGVFLYENAAIDAAKENGLYTNESEVDIWKTKSSRVCFGVFLYENAAIDAAKENGLYTNESEVDIIECELGKFEEL